MVFHWKVLQCNEIYKMLISKLLVRMTSHWHLICSQEKQELLCVKEIKTGVLMLLVCAAIYVQIDPQIWSGLCQLIGRLMTGRI